MKYTIHGFQQQKLLDLKLNNDDALILKFIKDMYYSTGAETITENNHKYMWINYSFLIKQIPIIGSKSLLMKRIRKFSDLDLIDRLLKKVRKNQRGNWAYIRPMEKFKFLEEYEVKNDNNLVENIDNLVENIDKGYVESRQALYKNDTSLMYNLHNKDSINKDSINKDTINKDNNYKAKKNKSKKISLVNYAEFVSMSKNEYEILELEHGEQATKEMITILDNYKGSSGKKYKSDYRAILSWVITAYKKRNNNKNENVSQMDVLKEIYQEFDRNERGDFID
ncbi:MAG: hypothetical protein ABF289_16835 [Clostridiales bacterium]